MIQHHTLCEVNVYMFAFLMRKQENGSQNVSTLWMCSLQGSLSGSVQQYPIFAHASALLFRQFSKNAETTL